MQKYLVFLFLFSQISVAADFLKEAKEDLISPFNTDAIQVVEVGGALTLATLAFSKKVRVNLQNDVATDRPMGHSSNYFQLLGQSWPNIGYILYMGTDYYLNRHELSYERAELMTKATLYSGAMTDVLKRVFNERRPNGSTFSFPSGHTTTIFAFSSVIAMEHSPAWGISANVLAAFVGFSRMNDNAHYLHDVLAGATIGGMYGTGLYYAEKNRALKKAKTESAFLLVPVHKGLMTNVSFLY